MMSGAFDREALSLDCPQGFVKVCEGTAAVLFPPPMLKGNEQQPNRGDDDNQAVFYNPAQVVNRDLSICMIELFSRLRLTEPRHRGGTKAGITILEALSATGLRAIRYYKEITNVRYIIANDLDGDAVACIGRNCVYNKVPIITPDFSTNCPAGAVTLTPEAEGGGVASGGGIIPHKADAIGLMHLLGMNSGIHGGQRLCLMEPETEKLVPVLQQELMDVVDLDPYGTACPFLDAAFGCVKEGGLMLVTSTDSAILCGNYVDTCHAKYNSVPYKGSHCHEMAVRILLAAIERVANKHKRYIVPILSLHIDFYVRCFFRVYTQPAEVKLSACKLGYQLQCTHCPAFWVRPMATAKPSRKRGHNESNSAVTRAGPEAVTAPMPAEQYPAAPARQTEPRLQSLMLQNLPKLVHKDGTEATRAEGPLMDNGCPVCGSSVSFSGPIYAAPTQSRDVLPQLLKVIKERDAEERLTATARISGLVQVAMEELPECPLFYYLPDIASYVRVRCPPTPNFVAALGRLGYSCSQVHCEGAGVKTDCPAEIIFAVMAQWKILQDALDAAPVGNAENATTSVPFPEEKKIVTEVVRSPRSNKKLRGELHHRLLVQPRTDANFEYDRQYDFRRQATGMTKFMPNAPGWGPKRRHQGAYNVEAAAGQA